MEKSKLELLYDHFFNELKRSRAADYESEETKINEQYLRDIENAMTGNITPVREEMLEAVYKTVIEKSDEILDSDILFKSGDK